MAPLPTPTGVLPRWRRMVLARTPTRILDDPFGFLLIIMCLLTGVLYLLGGPPPRSVAEQLPVWLVRTWGGFLAAGGSLCMLGMARSRALWEWTGLHLLGPAAFAYGLATLAYAGTRAFFAAGLTLAFSGACYLQAYRVRTTALLVQAAHHRNGTS